MDNNWRGRGRGRGRGSYNNNRDNNSAFNANNNNQGGSSILSRLGPIHNTNNDDSRNNKNFNHQNNNNYNGNRPQNNNSYNNNRPPNNNTNYNNRSQNNPNYNNNSHNNGNYNGSHRGSRAFSNNFRKRNDHLLQMDEDIEVEPSPTGGNRTVGQGQKPTRMAGNSPFLADFLSARWNASNGYLSLDELPQTQKSISTVITRLLDEAKFYYGDSLITFSARGNKLWSVVPLRKLVDFFPNLQNLSLENNDIADFRSLDLFSNKFPQLKELVLTGNPIQTSSSLDQYQQEILKRFPSLQTLDFQPVGNASTPVPLSVPLPVPVRTSFFDQDSTRLVAQDLLSKYFPLFDSNRLSLADLYDPQSVFSCVFSNGNFQQQQAWGSNQIPYGQRLVVGSENIIKRFGLLPTTLHDLSSADNFVTDGWQMQGSPAHPVVVFLNVHGEFSESGVRLSFDRSFVIAPSAPGSRAQIAGWSYIILSDSLVVRNFSCKPASLVTAV